MKDISNHTSKMLYVAKAFAILCVVAAHMSFPQQFLFIDIIKVSLSQIGVFTFFIVSGFFYSRTEGDSKRFWVKKLKTLFVPWLIFSSLVFLVSVVVFNKDFSVLGFILHFTGRTSIYWYMSVLVICLFLFKFILSVKNDFVLLVLFVLSILSVILTAIGVIPSTQQFDHSMNIFNWLGIFSIGVYIRRKNLLEKLIGIIPTVFSLIAVIISLIIAVSINKPIACYVSTTSLPIEIFGFVLVLNASHYLSNAKLLVDIGKKSFFIYLTHIQLVGIINTRLPYNMLFLILRPFIALCVCYLVAFIFRKVLGLFKLSKYNYIFGLDR